MLLVIVIYLILGSVSNSIVQAAGLRPIKYYGVDRGNPITDANYSLLSAHAVDTVVVDTSISSSSDWQNVINLAIKYNFKVVIWPNQGGDYPGCGWETPFSNPQNGDYIWRVKAMLDVIGNNPQVIGIVSAHEAEWNSSNCLDSISDMATIKAQLKDYIYTKFSRTDFKVWNYIDNISDIENISDYSGPADIGRIMDVAVIWQHCFGGAEGTCPQAQQKIVNDRNALVSAGLEGKVELVFLFQTFAMGSGYRMPTSAEMHDWSCNFLNTGALDGFIYYTWGACWYDSDLYCPASTRPNQNLWPNMNNIYNECAVKGPVTTIVPTTNITPSSQPTIPPGSTGLSLTLFLHGIGKAGDNVNPQGGGNTDPSNPQRQVKLEVSNSANQLVLTQQGSINYNTTAGNFQGTVALGTLASGLYTIKVTVPQYLIKTIPGIVSLTSNQTTTLDPLALVTGDSNGDNLLSILDYNMILDCYSDLAPAKNCADANKKLMTDLTDDGSINQFDYNLFLRELSVQSGQ
jgi:hypothetical protein